MAHRIAQALSKLFERHRIIFWYDVKKELRSDFEVFGSLISAIYNDVNVNYKKFGKALKKVPGLL